MTTTTYCNPPCGAVQTATGPAFNRCGVTVANVVTLHIGDLECSPALGTRSDLSSTALHAANIAQRLLTLYVPSIRLGLLTIG